MTFETNATAKLAISGTIEYRDADGNIIKTVPINGSIPLEELNDDDLGE